ncbi:unnamed protein product [Lymnaea stagnalis]|uniref:Uncharacterized protein n=1 Tax=Lymnaea stagnalis TaxID=6523 RepID=A0AAV2IMG4_LYMST
MDAMQDAILLNPKGYHAFLLVVRYGGRFTFEDKEVIRILKGTIRSSRKINRNIESHRGGNNINREGTIFKVSQKIPN